MIYLLAAYFIYLLVYAIVSYAIIFHLVRFRVEGDKSRAVMIAYLVVSGLIVIGSIAFLRAGGQS